MMKRVIVSFLILLPILCSAQFEASMFTTNNQKLIEQAVQDGFMVIAQAYQLEDSVSHQRFGRHGDKNFGKIRELGIRVGDGIVFPKSLLTPWESDSNFRRYRDTYIPVRSSASVIEFNDTVSRGIILAEDSIRKVSDSLMALNYYSSRIRGFEYERYEHPVEGWLVWMGSDTSLDGWKGKVPVMSIYRKSIDFNPDMSFYEIEPPQTHGFIWGGIFIVPEQTEIGQLTFKLGGIPVKTDEGKWVIEEMYTSEKDNFIQEDELTPLPMTHNKSKKSKKK